MSSTIKKKNGWITSSFGNFNSAQSSQSNSVRPHKRKNDDRAFEESKSGPSGLLDSCKVPTASLPWTEKYRPITENDLAVHKKKVAEVRDWLLSNLTSVSKRNDSNILVLTGPAGAGKSATIDVLKRDLNIEIQEWSTSITNTSEEFSAWKDFRVLSADSQKKQFQDFLLRANKYPVLSISGEESATSVPGQKIVLVEEIPNVFYRNVTDFHEILRRFHATCRNPLVFIISDSSISESSVYSLFPKRIQLELNITCISFNAIASSSLTKALNKIIISESQLTTKHLKTATKDIMDLIVSSANGDIRSCINSLQFYCTNENASKKCLSASSTISSKNKPVDKSKTNSKPSNESNALLFGRDASLFLFKALGKILYCKREPMGDGDTSKKLPKHLMRYKRDKLLIDPEEIVEKTHVANDVFNLYLHQNYLGFYSNIGDVTDASQYFSDADIITGRWSTRDTLQYYSSCIATRGVIFSNSHRSNSITGAVSGGWRPLQKPQWFEAFKEENSNKRTAEDLFYDFRHPAIDLHTDVLPFVAKTNIPLRTPGHIAFVQMITRFNINVFRTSSTLGQNENDAADEVSTEEDNENNRKITSNQCEDDSISISQVLVGTQQSNEDVNSYEEGLIEDFSDDDDFAELLFI